MNPTNVEHVQSPEFIQPGAFLALEREKRGIAIEQIATRLNLRVQVIAHLEADEYSQLPQPVFVQGYIRAYCKFMGISAADELIQAYLSIKPQDVKHERYLWQNKQHPNKNERWLYWMTAAFIVVSAVSVSMWVYENKNSENLLTNQWHHAVKIAPSAVKENSQANSGDLSKVRRLLSLSNNDSFSPKDME